MIDIYSDLCIGLSNALRNMWCVVLIWIRVWLAQVVLVDQIMCAVCDNVVNKFACFCFQNTCKFMHKHIIPELFSMLTCNEVFYGDQSKSFEPVHEKPTIWSSDQV